MPTRTRTRQSTRTTQARTGAAQTLVLDPSAFDSLGDQGQRSAGVERSELTGERSESPSEWSERRPDTTRVRAALSKRRARSDDLESESGVVAFGAIQRLGATETSSSESANS
jgi:hypothetical protein